MIVKYCIVPHDADIVLRYFNIDTNEYDSIPKYDIAVKNTVRVICAELNLLESQVDVYVKYEEFNVEDLV